MKKTPIIEIKPTAFNKIKENIKKMLPEKKETIIKHINETLYNARKVWPYGDIELFLLNEKLYALVCGEGKRGAGKYVLVYDASKKYLDNKWRIVSSESLYGTRFGSMVDKLTGCGSHAKHIGWIKC